MKNRNTFRSLVVLAALAAGTASMADFRPATALAPTLRGESAVELRAPMKVTIVYSSTSREEFRITSDEDLKKIEKLFVVTEDGRGGVVVSQGGKSYLDEMVSSRRARIALYPGATFVTAGPVFDAYLGRTTGGSLSAQGLLIAAAVPINVKAPGSRSGKASNELSASLDDVAPLRPASFVPDWSVGGWYFSRLGSVKSADLYQIDTRLMVNEFFGLQLAYINSTDIDAQAWTFHAIGRLSSNRFSGRSNPWELSAGVGPYINLSPRADNRQNPVIQPYQSVGLSVFVSGSMALSQSLSRYSLHGSVWMINDRNTLTTRMALGVGYSF